MTREAGVRAPLQALPEPADGLVPPLGGQQLSDDKLCLMINWVKSIK